MNPFKDLKKKGEKFIAKEVIKHLLHHLFDFHGKKLDKNDIIKLIEIIAPKI